MFKKDWGKKKKIFFLSSKSKYVSFCIDLLNISIAQGPRDEQNNNKVICCSFIYNWNFFIFMFTIFCREIYFQIMKAKEKASKIKNYFVLTPQNLGFTTPEPSPLPPSSYATATIDFGVVNFSRVYTVNEIRAPHKNSTNDIIARIVIY